MQFGGLERKLKIAAKCRDRICKETNYTTSSQLKRPEIDQVELLKILIDIADVDINLYPNISVSTERAY